MLRAPFPSGRKSLLLLALSAVIIGSAWWWQRPPPEPVHDGRRLSEYVFNHETWRHAQVNMLIPPGMPQRIREFGPGAIPWLAYKIKHGRHSPDYGVALPFSSAPDWLRQWVPERWGGLRWPLNNDERSDAAMALLSLGPDAAPAIPILIESLKDGDAASLREVTMTLHEIGPASWPAVYDLLQHGSVATRTALLYAIDQRVGRDQYPAPDDEAALVIADLVQLCGDPNAGIRMQAAGAIGNARERRMQTALFETALPALIRLLSDPDGDVRFSAVDAIVYFEAEGTAAIPRLIELLDDPSSSIRGYSAVALRVTDRSEKRSATHLEAMLHDPEETCRGAAARTLNEFGLLSNKNDPALQEPDARMILR